MKPARGFAPIIVIVIIALFIGVVAVGQLKQKLQPTSQSQTTKQNTVTYTTKAECETKSGSGCICMFTKPDTAQSNPDCTGWQPQQTSISNPTANWKTYKNDKYGYTFMYPNDFKFSDQYVIVNNEVSDQEEVRVTKEPYTIFSVDSLPSKKTYNEIRQDFSTGFPKIKTGTLAETKVNDTSAISYKDSYDETFTYFEFVRNGIKFNLAIHDKKSEESVSNSPNYFAKQILSSFKFTN